MNALKQTYIDRAQHHQDADEIVQGLYWEKGKGCCVGCLAHANENAHCALEKQTNIPEWLSRVADAIHEGLTVDESKLWPARFIKAVPDQIFSKEWSALEIDKKIKAPFLIMVLESTLDTFDHSKFPDVKSALEGSIALWKRDDIGSKEWNKAAEAAAEATAEAAEAAEATEATEAATWASWAAARSARSARSAARAATWAAEAAEAARSAARAARAVARAATWASWAAEAARSATWASRASRAAKYKQFSDRLVEIMENAASLPAHATQTDQREV